jgi:1,4-dihydroxy-2-naphthoate octaprenyltransferase
MGSTASSSAPFWVWLLAGRSNFPVFAVLFAITSLHGIHANLRAQLRDIEGDPKAGSITLAVRLGAKHTFLLAVWIRVVELIGVLTMSLLFGAPWGWIWVLPVAILLAAGIATAPRFYEKTRDRIGQTAALSLWVYMSFLTEIAILGAFHPVFAIPVAVVMFLWFRVVRKGYYGRLVGGRLAAEWHERHYPSSATRAELGAP